MKTAPKLEKFESLELSKCQTVGQIMEAMSKTPGGSGMLGRVAMSLRELISHDHLPVVVFDGLPDSRLAELLRMMTNRKWFSGVVTPEQYASHGEGEIVLVVGRFSERNE